MVAMAYQEEYEWQDYAACRGLGIDSEFFKEGQGETYPEARKFCSSCAVVVDCLISALDSDAVGMWGCTSPDERRAIRFRMDDNYTFKQAVEKTWNVQRKKGKRGQLVPPKTIWREWNA
jgi:hypothetical protein